MTEDRWWTEVSRVCQEEGVRIKMYIHFMGKFIGFDIQCYVNADWSMFLYGIDSDIDGNLKAHGFPPRVNYEVTWNGQGCTIE